MSKRALFPRPNAQLAQQVAKWLEARAVIVLAFGPAAAQGRPYELKGGFYGDCPLLHAVVGDLGMELVEDLDKGFLDSEDLARVLKLTEGAR